MPIQENIPSKRVVAVIDHKPDISRKPIESANNILLIDTDKKNNNVIETTNVEEIRKLIKKERVSISVLMDVDKLNESTDIVLLQAIIEISKLRHQVFQMYRMPLGSVGTKKKDNESTNNEEDLNALELMDKFMMENNLKINDIYNNKVLDSFFHVPVAVQRFDEVFKGKKQKISTETDQENQS